MDISPVLAVLLPQLGKQHSRFVGFLLVPMLRFRRTELFGIVGVLARGLDAEQLLTRQSREIQPVPQ